MLTHTLAEELTVRQLMRYPNLTQERERELLRLRATANSEAARKRAIEELVASHAKLVFARLGKYRAAYRDDHSLRWDLASAGFTGLMQAVHKFDESFENRLSSFAEKWISSAMSDYYHRNKRIVRLSLGANYKALAASASRRVFEATLACVRDGIEPTTAEVNRRAAEILRVPVAMLEEILAYNSRSDESLDAPVGEGDATLGESLSDDDALSPEDDVIERLDRVKRAQAVKVHLQRLSDSERDVVQTISYSENEANARQTLAKKYGVSTSRISQIFGMAKSKLQAAVMDEFGKDAAPFVRITATRAPKVANGSR